MWIKTEHVISATEPCQEMSTETRRRQCFLVKCQFRTTSLRNTENNCSSLHQSAWKLDEIGFWRRDLLVDVYQFAVTLPAWSLDHKQGLAREKNCPLPKSRTGHEGKIPRRWMEHWAIAGSKLDQCRIHWAGVMSVCGWMVTPVLGPYAFSNTFHPKLTLRALN